MLIQLSCWLHLGYSTNPKQIFLKYKVNEDGTLSIPLLNSIYPMCICTNRSTSQRNMHLSQCSGNIFFHWKNLHSTIPLVTSCQTMRINSPAPISTTRYTKEPHLCEGTAHPRIHPGRPSVYFLSRWNQSPTFGSNHLRANERYKTTTICKLQNTALWWYNIPKPIQLSFFFPFFEMKTWHTLNLTGFFLTGCFALSNIF